MKVEYRVRPVSRYIVTRFEDNEAGGQTVGQVGEYDNAQTAYEVGYALCKSEHQRLGYPLDDMRVIYPDPMLKYPPQPAEFELDQTRTTGKPLAS